MYLHLPDVQQPGPLSVIVSKCCKVSLLPRVGLAATGYVAGYMNRMGVLMLLIAGGVGDAVQ
jgi:hypothetical protein